MPTRRGLTRFGVRTTGFLLAVGIGLLLFGAVPARTPLGIWEVLLVVVLGIIGIAIGSRVAGRLFPTYNVAEIEVANMITRHRRGGGVPMGPLATPADDIVEQIERANTDPSVRGLIVKLNTPGGEVVPSEDIRQATADFDGPTVAYAEDMAASGGYLIASGADEIHARRGAMVGSIGVNGSQLGRDELRDKLGLEYRRFVEGEFKDSPSPWREIEQEEIEYFQGLLGTFYDQFVETVAEGVELEEGDVRDTEARLYPGDRAAELGLVDRAGPRQDMETRLAERLDIDDLVVKEFEPRPRISARFGSAAAGIAFAFGRGIGTALVGERRQSVRLE